MLRKYSNRGRRYFTRTSSAVLSCIKLYAGDGLVFSRAGGRSIQGCTTRVDRADGLCIRLVASSLRQLSKLNGYSKVQE